MQSSFGARTTTDEVLAGVDLGGRVFVVTGATGGLGAETVRALASVGATVIATGRNRERGEAIAKVAREISGNRETRFEELDLADLASVRRFARRLDSLVDRVDVLINNGAVMACPLARTVDGYELQLATNHLSHFLLTLSLLPLLGRASGPRVVVVSSAAHWMGGVDLEDLDFRRRPYDPWLAYGQSKTANALFAQEFQHRFGSDGMSAYALHPGAIQTELGRNVDESIAVPVAPELMKTIPQGAATQVWAATSPALADSGGRYLEDCGLAEPREERVENSTAFGVAPHARDSEVARQLWEVSAQMVGIDATPGAAS